MSTILSLDFETVQLRYEITNQSLYFRLSQVAGARLRDNNPGISDLSDPNRPLKLNEKISELYDNEWTDAIEILEKEQDEQAAIGTLLNIVMVTCNIRVSLTFNQNKKTHS